VLLAKVMGQVVAAQLSQARRGKPKASKPIVAKRALF
jgi:hypothetical protein